MGKIYHLKKCSFLTEYKYQCLQTSVFVFGQESEKFLTNYQNMNFVETIFIAAEHWVNFTEHREDTSRRTKKVTMNRAEDESAIADMRNTLCYFVN